MPLPPPPLLVFRWLIPTWLDSRSKYARSVINTSTCSTNCAMPSASASRRRGTLRLMIRLSWRASTSLVYKSQRAASVWAPRRASLPYRPFVCPHRAKRAHRLEPKLASRGLGGFRGMMPVPRAGDTVSPSAASRAGALCGSGGHHLARLNAA